MATKKPVPVVEEAVWTSLTEMSEQYDLLEKIEGGFKSEYEEAKRRREQCERKIIEVMEEQEMKSFRREDGVLFSKATTLYADFIDRDALLKAVEEEGMEEEYTYVEFRKKRWNEWVRLAVDEGREMLDGLAARATTYLSRRAK